MKKEVIANLNWNEISNGTSYLYGSKVTFLEDEVNYHNPLIASGKAIKIFYSRTNYQGNRKSPELPLLIPGQSYDLVLDATIRPRNRIFIIVEFFNRQGENISNAILRDESVSFLYPNDAFTYRIKIMTAGCELIVFRSLRLFKNDTSKQFKDSTPSRGYLKEHVPEDLQLVRTLINRE